MKNEISYEWDYEEIDESEDIIDHNHATTLRGFGFDYINDKSFRLVLVRDFGNAINGLEDRSWAYVDDKKLPEYFTDIDNCKIAKIPAKFHKELERYYDSF